MREIKYRAKAADGSWLYGIPQKTYLGNWMMLDKSGVGRYVDPETICQYTGLKDKEGRVIYEGDIIMMIGCRYIACYASTHARFLFLRQDGDGYEEPNDRRCSDYLIIGNKFDNPNLLNKQQ